MDLKTLANDGTPNRLTLPRGDLQSSSTQTKGSFLLLQLPAGWKADDLVDARFVSKSQQQQVALVSDTKETSFWVSNVQSSNCFVLVPPFDNNDDDDSIRESAPKKTKLDPLLRTIPTRLLKPGGSGATFLELRPKLLKVTDLHHALVQAQAVLDPYSDSTTTPRGITVDNLATELQQSMTEIQKGLWGMEGVFVYKNDNQKDTVLLLSEETQMNVQHAIVSTLTEVEDCHDYAERGVSVDRCVNWMVQRMSEEERFAQDRAVVRDCLLRLAQENASSMEDDEGEEDDKVVKLDVAKVRLFYGCDCRFFIIIKGLF